VDRIPKHLIWAEPYETYITHLGCHLIRGGGAKSAAGSALHYWFLFEPKTGKFTEVAVPDELSNTEAFCYDPVTKLVLLFCWGDAGGSKRIDVWTFDLATMKTARVRTSGPTPQNEPRFQPVLYAPEHNAFLYLNHVSGNADETWVYRHRRLAAASQEMK